MPCGHLCIVVKHQKNVYETEYKKYGLRPLQNGGQVRIGKTWL